jgi:hypothetical protein
MSEIHNHSIQLMFNALMGYIHQNQLVIQQAQASYAVTPADWSHAMATLFYRVAGHLIAANDVQCRIEFYKNSPTEISNMMLKEANADETQRNLVQTCVAILQDNKTDITAISLAQIDSLANGAAYCYTLWPEYLFKTDSYQIWPINSNEFKARLMSECAYTALQLYGLCDDLAAEIFGQK